jgi:hypothetical protein
MKNFSKWVHTVKWTNIGVGVVHVIAIASGVFPANPWLIAAQGVIAALMPSVLQTAEPAK